MLRFQEFYEDLAKAESRGAKEEKSSHSLEIITFYVSMKIRKEVQSIYTL